MITIAEPSAVDIEADTRPNVNSGSKSGDAISAARDEPGANLVGIKE